MRLQGGIIYQGHLYDCVIHHPTFGRSAFKGTELMHIYLSISKSMIFAESPLWLKGGRRLLCAISKPRHLAFRDNGTGALTSLVHVARKRTTKGRLRGHVLPPAHWLVTVQSLDYMLKNLIRPSQRKGATSLMKLTTSISWNHIQSVSDIYTLRAHIPSLPFTSLSSSDNRSSFVGIMIHGCISRKIK